MKFFIPLLLLTVIFSSCQKDDDDSVTAVSISKIVVNTMPLTDQGGDWDIGSDADVFFRIESGTSVLYKHAVPVDNVNSSGLPLQLSIPNTYQLPAIDQSYTVSLYDYDSGSPDDFIGAVQFNPESYKNDRSPKETFSGNGVQIEIYFNWK